MPLTTPWGVADFTQTLPVPGTESPMRQNLPLNITVVSTPSHGGIFVPLELLHRIPKAEQDFAKKWSGDPQWYEEDVCANSVVLAFPEVFTSVSDTDKARYRKWLNDSMRRT